MADQAARHGVENAPAHEARGCGDPDGDVVPGHGRRGWQRLQDGALGFDGRGVAAVVLRDRAGDEGAIGVQIVEVGRPAQQ